MVQPRVIHPNIHVNDITNLFQNAASSQFPERVEFILADWAQSCLLEGSSEMGSSHCSRPLVLWRSVMGLICRTRPFVLTTSTDW